MKKISFLSAVMTVLALSGAGVAISSWFRATVWFSGFCVVFIGTWCVLFTACLVVLNRGKHTPNQALLRSVPTADTPCRKAS